MARLDAHAGKAFAGQVAKAHHRGTADGAAAHLDQPADGGHHHLDERFTLIAQAADEEIEPAGGIGLEPGAEVEEGGVVGGGAGGQRQGAGDNRHIGRSAPGDQPLFLLVHQRLGAIGGGLQFADLAAQAHVLRLGAVAGADQGDGAEYREDDGAEQRRDQNDLAGVEVVAEHSGGRNGSGRARRRR